MIRSIQVVLATLVAVAVLTTAAAAGQPGKPAAPNPWLVQSVDAEAGTVTMGKDGADPQTYKFDKKFGKVMVDNKPADLSKIQVGMRADFIGNTNNVSRIDARTYTPPKTPKK